MKIKNRRRFANTIIISLIIIDAILLGVVVICFAGSMVSLIYDSYFGFEYRKGTTWASEDQTIRLTYLEDLYYQGVITNGEEIEVIFWTGGTSIDAYRIEEFVKGENNRDRRIEHWSIEKVRNNRIEIQIYETTYFEEGEKIVLYRQ